MRGRLNPVGTAGSPRLCPVSGMGRFDAGLRALEYMRKLDTMTRGMRLVTEGPSMPIATGQAARTLMRLGSTLEAARSMQQQFDRIEQARRFSSQIDAAMESVRMADVDRAMNLAFGTYSTLLQTAAQQPLPADFTVIGRRPETEAMERDADRAARELLGLTGLDAEEALAEARAAGESDLADAIRTYREDPSDDVSVVIEKADLDQTNELLRKILDGVRDKTFGAREWIEVAMLMFMILTLAAMIYTWQNPVHDQAPQPTAPAQAPSTPTSRAPAAEPTHGAHEQLPHRGRSDADEPERPDADDRPSSSEP